jgi:hypothetical protein
MFVCSLRHRLFCCVLPIALALFASTGCAPKGKAVVKGTVSFGGQPLSTGMITFVTPDNRSGSGLIGKDGRYTVADAPVGEAKIFITIPKPTGEALRMPKPPPGLGAMKPPEGGAGPKTPKGGADTEMPDPSRFPRIPDKYTKAETTDLTFTVKRGENKHDLTLKP